MLLRNHSNKTLDDKGLVCSVCRSTLGTDSWSHDSRDEGLHWVVLSPLSTFLHHLSEMANLIMVSPVHFKVLYYFLLTTYPG